MFVSTYDDSAVSSHCAFNEFIVIRILTFSYFIAFCFNQFAGNGKQLNDLREIVNWVLFGQGLSDSLIFSHYFLRENELNSSLFPGL